MITITKKSSGSMLTVMGLDVSTHTGVVVLGYYLASGRWDTVFSDEINLPALPKTATMVQRINRTFDLGGAVAGYVGRFKPKAIAIEGYSYGAVQAQVTMVELGSEVRRRLVDHVTGPFAQEEGNSDIKLLEVPPSTLKKYVLGKGVGKKEQVMMQVFKRWGYEAGTNNLADAYVLAQIAASTMHPEKGLTKPQMEVLKMVAAKNA